MASITVPGVVDSVGISGGSRVTTISTHPSTDRPSVTVELKQAPLQTPPFAANDAVNVTIESA